jgi:hypothetical protein
MLFKLKVESLKNNIPHTTSSGEVGEGFDRQAVDRTLDKALIGWPIRLLIARFRKASR